MTKLMDGWLKSKWNKGTTKKVRAEVNRVRSSYFEIKKIKLEHSHVYDGFNITMTSAEGTNYRAFFGYGGGLKNTVVF